MAYYWGINRGNAPGPTWAGINRTANLSNVPKLEISESLVALPKQESTRKWAFQKNPVAAENSLRDAHPTPSVSETVRKVKYDQLLARPGLTPEERQAIVLQKMKSLDNDTRKEVKQEFLDDFRAWVLGEGKPQDYVKTGWWKVDGRGAPIPEKPEFLKRGRPLSKHPSVLNWLEQGIDAKIAYERDLAKLKLLVQSRDNLNIDQLWKVYKYFVRGQDIEEEIEDDYNFYHGPNAQFAQPPTLASTPVRPTIPVSNEPRVVNAPAIQKARRSRADRQKSIARTQGVSTKKITQQEENEEETADEPTKAVTIAASSDEKNEAIRQEIAATKQKLAESQARLAAPSPPSPPEPAPEPSTIATTTPGKIEEESDDEIPEEEEKYSVKHWRKMKEQILRGKGSPERKAKLAKRYEEGEKKALQKMLNA